MLNGFIVAASWLNRSVANMTEPASNLSTAPPTSRAGWVVRRCRDHEEMEKLHLRDWQAVNAAERMAAAWEMVVEMWLLKNLNPDELRFQRCVTRLA
jgi:hypothetical protein